MTPEIKVGPDRDALWDAWHGKVWHAGMASGHIREAQLLGALAVFVEDGFLRERMESVLYPDRLNFAQAWDEAHKESEAA